MITSKKLTAERIAEIEKFQITYDEDSQNLQRKNCRNLYRIIRSILILLLKK